MPFFWQTMYFQPYFSVMFKKKVTIIFLLLTIINIVIFVFRDHFMYRPFSGYKELYECTDADCLEKWNLFKNDYPVDELNQAKKISDSVIGKKSISTEEKILKIGSFVHNRFKNQMGKPNQEVLTASPMNQYNMLSSSDSLKLWCGNFATIFSYFCWSQGIVTRNIEIMNLADHHVLNECFIPSTNQWQMVDPTNNMLKLQSGEKILNLRTFKESLDKKLTVSVSHGSDSLRENLLDPQASHILNYYKPEHPHYYYHRIDNEKAFSTSNKIKQYFLPVSWYEIYKPAGVHNLPFYVKQIFILLWLISFFVFNLSRTKFRI